MMIEKRRYKRFTLNDREVRGKMVLATDVKVIDISVSGIALRANRRLNIGSDYALKLEGIKAISLRGTVVWSSLIETRKGPKGEMIPVYSAGMQFKNMSAERIKELQCFIESHKIREVHVIGGTRLNIRFHIKDPDNAVLIYPDNYIVKTISHGGMLIECSRNFQIESRIPMEMFIYDDKTLKFLGRVASCKPLDKEDRKQYDIGIEFLNLTEKDREALASFIKRGAMTDKYTGCEVETNAGKSAQGDITDISSEFVDMSIESLDLPGKEL